MPVRVPVVALVLVLGLTCGLVAVAVLSATPGNPSAPGPSVTRSEPKGTERFAVGVLHAWDARRAAAWARADSAALSRLYTHRCSAGAADVRLLGRYAARGLVVREMRMQVLRARVLVVRPGRLELEVTDRLAGARAARAGDESSGHLLPADQPTTRRLVLVRHHGQWLVASVRVAEGSGGR